MESNRYEQEVTGCVGQQSTLTEQDRSLDTQTENKHTQTDR
jgi:hypothetical protein